MQDGETSPAASGTPTKPAARLGRALPWKSPVTPGKTQPREATDRGSGAFRAAFTGPSMDPIRIVSI
jgi:hypothetical protein